jgi:hypothetical protein
MSDVGFKDMMYQLMQRYVCPLAALLYKEQGGAALDRLHSFVVFTPLSLSLSSTTGRTADRCLTSGRNAPVQVKYKIGEDLDLKEHVDDSEVTLNVSLGKSFAGSAL